MGSMKDAMVADHPHDGIVFDSCPLCHPAAPVVDNDLVTRSSSESHVVTSVPGADQKKVGIHDGVRAAFDTIESVRLDHIDGLHRINLESRCDLCRCSPGRPSAVPPSDVDVPAGELRSAIRSVDDALMAMQHARAILVSELDRLEGLVAQRAEHHPYGRRSIPMDCPEIVVLCGSTRFSEEWAKQRYWLTLAGVIVLTIGCDTKSDEGIGISPAEKLALDELHKRKIDLADRVLVLNVDGYIGESTRSEIDYAQSNAKPIDYLVPV